MRDTPGLKLVPEAVETNLVWVEVDRERQSTPQDVVERLKIAGVLVTVLGENVLRACTHLDVSRTDCERAADAIRRLAR